MKDVPLSCVVMFVVFVMALVTFSFVRACTSHPVVYISNTTGECVRVESTRPDQTCHNKPDTYDVIWVK